MKEIYLVYQGGYDEHGVAYVFDDEQLAVLVADALDNAYVFIPDINVSSKIKEYLLSGRKIFKVIVDDRGVVARLNDCLEEERITVDGHYHDWLCIKVWATCYDAAERYAEMYFKNVKPPDED